MHVALAEHNVARSQTIYGELISLESNSDALGLAVFILQRLLWNPDIAAEFRHAKVPHLYKDGKFNLLVPQRRHKYVDTPFCNPRGSNE